MGISREYSKEGERKDAEVDHAARGNGMSTSDRIVRRGDVAFIVLPGPAPFCILYTLMIP
jgi:hypothetical protein